MHHGHRRRKGNRSRNWDSERREWIVSARIERFFEPALLLALRDHPAHGYELVEQLNDWGPDYAVDSGNLYRMLRALEHDGLVTSAWSDPAQGGARRTYRLEPKGRRVLDAWARSLNGTESVLGRFRKQYDDPASKGKRK